MDSATLATLATASGACAGLRSYLVTRSARDFAAWLRRPRLTRIYQ